MHNLIVDVYNLIVDAYNFLLGNTLNNLQILFTWSRDYHIKPGPDQAAIDRQGWFVLSPMLDPMTSEGKS